MYYQINSVFNVVVRFVLDVQPIMLIYVQVAMMVISLTKEYAQLVQQVVLLVVILKIV
jgi:hypothetical protein